MRSDWAGFPASDSGCFGGWKRSAFGDANRHSMDGVRFYTKVKTVTARWPEDEAEGAGFFMPTMG